MNNLWLQDSLTPKQLQYISEMASGLSTLDIANRNFVSKHTVRNTIRTAKDRIGAVSTVNLIATAISKGWIVPEDNEKPYAYKVAK